MGFFTLKSNKSNLGQYIFSLSRKSATFYSVRNLILKTEQFFNPNRWALDFKIKLCSKRFSTMMPHGKYFFYLQWVTNCMTILFEFLRTSKLLFFHWQNGEKLLLRAGYYFLLQINTVVQNEGLCPVGFLDPTAGRGSWILKSNTDGHLVR